MDNIIQHFIKSSKIRQKSHNLRAFDEESDLGPVWSHPGSQVADRYQVLEMSIYVATTDRFHFKSFVCDQEDY